VRVTRLDELRESSTIDHRRSSGRLGSLWRCFGLRIQVGTLSACRFQPGIGLSLKPSTHLPLRLRQVPTRAAFWRRAGDLERLLTTAAAGEGWSILKHYLPL
jgi:hypothetical protein